MVGFTSTFAQTVPSLALAVRLKAPLPRARDRLRRSQPRGPDGRRAGALHGLHRLRRHGRGRFAFTELLVALCEGRDPAGLPGVLCRRDGVVAEAACAGPFDRLDELPTPDYEEYFRARRSAGHRARARPPRRVAAGRESARVLVGSEAPLHFCGAQRLTDHLPGQVAGPGPPGAGRALGAELDAVLRLRRQHPRHEYLDELFPPLRDAELDYKLFFEVKANLSRDADPDAGRRRRTAVPAGHRVAQLACARPHAQGRAARHRMSTCCVGPATTASMSAGTSSTGSRTRPSRTTASRPSSSRTSCTSSPPAHTGGSGWSASAPSSPIATASRRSGSPPSGTCRTSIPTRVNLEDLAYFFDYELEDTLARRGLRGGDEGSWTPGARPRPRDLKPELTVHRADGFIQILDGRDPEVVGVHRSKARWPRSTSD